MSESRYGSVQPCSSRCQIDFTCSGNGSGLGFVSMLCILIPYLCVSLMVKLLKESSDVRIGDK